MTLDLTQPQVPLVNAEKGLVDRRISPDQKIFELEQIFAPRLERQPDTQPGAPAHIETMVNEHAQLWLYESWAKWIAAENSQTLRDTGALTRDRI